MWPWSQLRHRVEIVPLSRGDSIHTHEKEAFVELLANDGGGGLDIVAIDW